MMQANLWSLEPYYQWTVCGLSIRTENEVHRGRKGKKVGGNQHLTSTSYMPEAMHTACH